MKLTELHPRWARPRPDEPFDLEGCQILVFDCPCLQGHKLRVAVSAEFHGNRNGTNVWKRSVSTMFESLTLHPSINAGCWHGTIVKGECS